MAQKFNIVAQGILMSNEGRIFANLSMVSSKYIEGVNLELIHILGIIHQIIICRHIIALTKFNKFNWDSAKLVVSIDTWN